MSENVVLVLPLELRAEVVRQSEAGYPRETCGLLVGKVRAVTVEVIRVAVAGNLASGRDRFELDPADWLATHDEARRAAHEIVGVWHAHPDHPAEPSPADAETVRSVTVASESSISRPRPTSDVSIMLSSVAPSMTRACPVMSARAIGDKNSASAKAIRYVLKIAMRKTNIMRTDMD